MASQDWEKNMQSTVRRTNEMILIERLQDNPDHLSQNRHELLKAAYDESLNPDTSKHLRLVPPKGQWGYSELSFSVNHPYPFRGRLQSASNLVQVWRRFLNKAQKEIILNVFDFDLQEIAIDLAKKAKAGISVQVGIDKSVIHARPEVKSIYDYLLANGVQVVAVNSVGLNHQKMAAIDWSDLERASVLFSSGNLTQSCLGPEGDLKDIKPRPKESIPNANHVITLKSWLLANLLHHELTKTLDPIFQLRGAQFPLTGAYQITGPGVDPQTLEAYPENSIIITFAPGGAYKSINKNILARIIERTTGPVRMIQFAFSSNAVAEALLSRAKKDYDETGKFDFLAVGDTPFAMQYWSQFLKMSGWTQQQVGDKKIYVESPVDQWRQSFSPRHFSNLRNRIYVAPRIYGNSYVEVKGKKHHVSAKIHHKILSTGDFSVVGTSFNFSDAAEKNNEQILLFRDPKIAEIVNGMTKWLTNNSRKTVTDEARRRNRYRIGDSQIPAEDLKDVETKAGAEAGQADKTGP